MGLKSVFFLQVADKKGSKWGEVLYAADDEILFPKNVAGGYEVDYEEEGASYRTLGNVAICRTLI